MSRGLGEAQKLILRALASLEAEHPGGGLRFFVWGIVDRAYELSPAMQAEHGSRQAARQARHQRWVDMADAGDADAKLFLALGRSLARTRRHPRARRKSPWDLSEAKLNPSRVLASLERRGLVHRSAIQGGGAAGLTEAGRALAVSVGSSCAPLPEEAA